MARRKSRFLRKPVEPFTVASDLSADEVLARMERVSFQGRNLATARRIWEKMLASAATIFLGTAGALSAGGMRLVIAHLIEHRYIDCLVSTGANLYHDLHETRGRRHFIGSPQMNLMEGTADNGEVKLGNYHVPVDPTAAKKMQGKVTVGVRPEAWRIVSENEGGLPVKVTVVEELGADSFVYGTSGVEGTPHDIIVRVSARDSVHKGETLYVTTDPQKVHVFDSETGERLSE